MASGALMGGGVTWMASGALMRGWGHMDGKWCTNGGWSHGWEVGALVLKLFVGFDKSGSIT